MDGSGSPVAPDLCDAEKMPSETHPDGCIVACPEVAEDQAGLANVTDTDTDADGSSDGATTGTTVGVFNIATSFTYKQIHRGFLDDSDCREYYEDAWIFGEEAIAAAEAAEAAAEAATDPASGNGTEEAGVSDPNGTYNLQCTYEKCL